MITNVIHISDNSFVLYVTVQRTATISHCRHVTSVLLLVWQAYWHLFYKKNTNRSSKMHRCIYAIIHRCRSSSSRFLFLLL